MNFRYQAAIARALGRFVDRGLVYKGKKPVHWCIHCRTALAEAEVEYADHVVAVDLRRVRARAGERGRTGRASAGARRPRRVRADLDDHAVDHPVEPRGRVPSGVRLRGVRGRRPRGHRRRGARADGRRTRSGARWRAGRAHERRRLEGLRFRHPLYERDSLGVLADYVTLEQGTGAVTPRPVTAPTTSSPACKYGLEIYAPVGPDGRFIDESGCLAGEQVFEANPAVRRR